LPGGVVLGVVAHRVVPPIGSLWSTMTPCIIAVRVAHLRTYVKGIVTLRYPISATAAEKPLPRKGRGSFPSWTSPVRPRSPALVKSRRLRRPTSIRLMYWPALKVKAPGLRTGRPACARPLDPVQELYEGGPHGGAPLSHGAPISLSGRANQPVASRRATPTGATPVTIRPGCS